MFSHKKFLALAALLVAGLASQSAMATTPANATLTNTATLTYDGGSVADSVSVTVELLPAAVSITDEPAGGTDSATENSTYTYTYEIVAQANGEDTYAITFDALVLNNLTGNSAAPNPVSNITLSATAADTAATSQTTISVPCDDSQDSDINGFVGGAPGEDVDVGGTITTVSSVDDNPTGGCSMTFADPVTVSVGTLIAEIATFDVTINDVGEDDGGGSPTLTYTVNITSTTDGAATVADTVVISIIAVTFTKFSANLTDAVTGGGSTETYDIDGAGSDFSSTTFYENGVSGQPGDIIAHVIVITIPASGTALTNASITDVLPEFVTYQDVANDSVGTFVDQSVISDAGAGGDRNANFPLTAGHSLGTLNANTTTRVGYSVQIDP